MPIDKQTFLKELAKENKIALADQKFIADEARSQILMLHNFNKQQVKKNLDSLIHEIETKTYELYRKHENKFGQKILQLLIEHLREKFNCSIENIGEKLGEYFNHLDSFFLSLSQSRKSRAGRTFENSLKALFKSLDYPFDDQQVIDGKPDFLIPSLA